MQPKRSYEGRLAVQGSKGPARQGWSRQNAIPLITLYSLLLPAGISVEVGPILLFPYRLLLLLLIPFIILEVRRNPFKPTLADAFLSFFALWVAISLGFHLGPANGIEPIGRELVDIGVAYLVFRTFVRDFDQLSWILRKLLPGVVVVAVILAYESITRDLLIASIIPVSGGEGEMQETIRLGLRRAVGPFRHPIHGGLIMASLLPLYATAKAPGWVKVTGTIASACAFFTVSTSAVLMLIMVIGLLFYWCLNVQLTQRPNWPMIVVPTLVTSFVIQLLATGGIMSFFIRHVAINSSSARYRKMIWEHGTNAVERNPVLGVGFASYDRPGWMSSGSLDNHWLAIALRHGIPATVFLLGTVIMACAYLVRSQRFSLEQRPVQQAALLICLVSFALSLFTVFAWNHLVVFFMALLGIAVGIGGETTAIRRSGPVKPAYRDLSPRPGRYATAD